MRCKLCKQPAVYVPLRFCREHFLAYYEKRVRHYFESTHVRNVKVLVAVSGGKDSAALADILVKIKADFGLELGLFTINLNIPDYSERGLDVAKELSRKYDMSLVVEDLKEYAHVIPDFAGPGAKPCGPCGTIKRYLLNKAAVERGYGYIATGHNLDDEFYFTMHNLLHRNVAQLRRGAKTLPPKPEHKLAGRIKPLYYLTEKENRLYCLLQGVPHDADECPFSKDNPQLAFKTEFGAKLSRDEKRNLLKSLQELQEPHVEVEVGEEGGQLHPCPRCGYPTTSSNDCAFCKLMERKVVQE
jgi:uncharacterized protein (TIGR00269 family)